MKKTIAALALAALCGPALADPRETQLYPGPYGVYTDDTNPVNTALTASFTGTGYNPVGLRIVMDLEAVAVFTQAADIAVTCTPPSGPAFVVYMSQVGEFDTLTDVTRIVSFPPGVSAAGTWSFLLWDLFEDGGGAEESTASNIRLSLEALTPPQPVVDLGVLGPGVHVAGDNLEVAGDSWFKFTIPAGNDLAAPRYIDITTNGSDFDSVIGLYNSSGVLVRMDDEDGLEFASFLSFGYGGGSTLGDDDLGDDTFSDGRDGRLPAGTYYLAVIDYGAGDWNLGNIWAVTPSPAGAAGTVTLIISIGDTPAPGGTPPAATDIGTVVPGEWGYEVTIDAGGEVAWLKFTAASAFSNASGRYLDIDTTGSTIGTNPNFPNDTEIGVYTQSGLLGASDDDDGHVWTSALSFGATTPVRTPIGSGLPGNGRDGPLPAGVYYLALTQHNAEFAHSFIATTTGADTGTIAANFRSNFPTGCSTADVGVQGGIPGSDNRLNNNDFIVFIGWFFSADPRADIGRQGGIAPGDGLFNNNDFIVYINAFFTDGPNCNG